MELQTNNKNKKIAYLGLFTAMALIFSYVEFLIPVNLGIPGIKLGLANALIIIILYLFGKKEACIVSLLRVLISSFLFGNAYSLIYSLAGAALSLLIMIIFKKTGKFSFVGVSVTGGIFHNIGQLLVAIITVHQINLFYYGGILIISGVITGSLIGIICLTVYKRVETYVRL